MSNKDRHRANPDDTALPHTPQRPHDGMGDGAAAYRAIQVQDDDAGNEMREGDEVTIAEDGSTQPMTREQRLTLGQLQRFQMAVNNKNRRKSRGTRWTAKTAGRDQLEFDNLFNETTELPREVTISTYPWPMWLFGAVILIATTIYIDQVHRKSLASVDGKKDKDWWKYLVGIAVYLLGVAVIANGRVETLRLHRETGRLTIRSTKPFCLIPQIRRERNVDREFRDIRDVRVEANGEFTGDVDTRCYKVHFEFVDGTHATALEVRSKTKSQQRCRMIKQFLMACAASTASHAVPPSSPDDNALQVSVNSTVAP